MNALWQFRVDFFSGCCKGINNIGMVAATAAEI